MAITVQPYPISTVRPEGMPNAMPRVDESALAIGAGFNQARQQQIAGQGLEQASGAFANIAERDFRVENDAKVETDLNGFIGEKQKALSGFVQLQGKEAVDAAGGVTESLTKMKQRLLDGAKNDYQRERLTSRLDAQFNDALGRIDSHTAREARQWNRDSVAAKGALLDRQGVLDRDNPDDLTAQMMAKSDIARDLARIEKGAPADSDIAKAYVIAEQSKFLKGVLQAKLDDGNKRAAYALYEKYGNVLKHDAGVAAAMKGVRTEIDGENAANGALAKVGLPQIRSGESAVPGVGKWGPQVQQAAHRAGVSPDLFQRVVGVESAGNERAVSSAGARGLSQLMPGTARDLGVDPDNPEQNLTGGARYLKQQLDRYKGDEKLALMAYNWGPGNVDRWMNAGADPSKVPAETQEYVRKIAGTPPGAALFKGDLKVGYEQAKADIMNRTDLAPEVRANALASLGKVETQVTSFQASALKSLRDEVNSTLAIAYLTPGVLKPGVLAAFADKAAALGEGELSTRYRALALMEGTIRDGVMMAPADRQKFIKELSEGLPRQILEGVSGANAEALTKANDAFAKLKQEHGDGLPFAADRVTSVAQQFADAGKGEKAREVAEWGMAALQAGQASKMTPQQQAAIRSDLEQKAQRYELTEQQGELYHQLRQIDRAQVAAFKADPFAAGQKLLTLPARAIDDAAGRAQDANAIAKARGLRESSIAPYSDDDFAALRSQADQNPQMGQQLFRSLAAKWQAHPEFIPLIAAGLSGKGEGDPVSRGYAAALSFYAEADPARRMVADQILGGTKLLRDLGDGGRKPQTSADAWQQTMQDKIGNAFVDMGGKVPAVISDAVRAVYTWQMHRAGKQGDKLDTDVLEGAIDSVVGKTITINGQTLLPPKGVDAYQFNNAVRTLTPLDLPGELRTINGSPVPPEKIARYATFTNAGGEGRYFVYMPDAAQGGKPDFVQRPDGQPYVLDIKPLLGRPAAAPAMLAPPQTRAVLAPPQTRAVPLMRRDDYSRPRP